MRFAVQNSKYGKLEKFFSSSRIPQRRPPLLFCGLSRMNS